MPLALLCAGASAAGIWWTPAYAREAPAWAAQGVRQDAVNLIVVVPLLLVAMAGLRRGSWRAWLVWLGVTGYLAYSYVLYAFFVHFGPIFPAYVAVLGLSSYAFFTALIEMPREVTARTLAGVTRDVAAEMFLLLQGVLFSVAWLGEVFAAIARTTAPPGVTDLGFTVNPVHVLDLAFVLPAMIATAVLLHRGRLYGRLLAVPLLVFSALMGAAIAGMSPTVVERGVAASWAAAAAWRAVHLARQVPGSATHADHRRFSR